MFLVKKYLRGSFLTQAIKNITNAFFSSKSYEIHLSRKLFGSVLNDDHFWWIRSRAMWPKYIKFISSDVFRFYQHLCIVFVLSFLRFWTEKVAFLNTYRKRIAENLDLNHQKRHDARGHLSSHNTESADSMQCILELIRIFTFSLL